MAAPPTKHWFSRPSCVPAAHFSGEAIPGFVAFNIKKHCTVVAFWRLRRHWWRCSSALEALNHRTLGYQRARSIALWSAGPAVLFYLAMFCSEPGYLLGFIPAIIAVTALAVEPRSFLRFAGESP